MRRFLVPLLLVGIAALAFGFGARETPPNIGIGGEDTEYISPLVSTGVQDTVTIPITVTTEGGNANVVVAYELVFQNANGDVVWRDGGVDESEPPGFFAGLMRGLGFAQRPTTVQIPATRDWDGTYLSSDQGSDGANVPDGDYSYVLTVTDAGGEAGASDPRTVVVDNTLPQATASAEYDVFSPDGDGQKDTVTLTQSSSTEDEWVGAISSGGSEVFRIEWTGSVTTDFEWDGKDLAGRDLDDGDYVYSLSSTDRAGNSFTFTMAAVTIDTATRPLSISLDNPAFSPNGDGTKDSVTMTFALLDLTGLETASVTISDDGGDEIATFDIRDTISQPLTFSGYLGPGMTNRLAEGTYTVTADATYENGASVSADPVDVVLDVTPPAGTVAVSSDVFSPEGDGLNDTVRVTHTVSGSDSWSGFVFIPGGSVLASYDFGTAVPRIVDWDGADLSGIWVPDGPYWYQMIGTDAAGNQTETNTVKVTVDRRPTTIDFKISSRYFSPNGDGQRDVVTVTPILSVPTGVDTYSVELRDGSGGTVLTLSGSGDLPSEIDWDGRGATGEVLPEGDYVATLSLVYKKGNRPEALSPVVSIDFTVPSVGLTANRNRFSPNGDGVEDTITFRPTVSPVAEIESFVGRVTSLGGTVAAEVSGPAIAPVPVVWDGVTNSGAVASDGSYVASLEVTHRNGTVRSASTGTIALGTGDDFDAPRVVLQFSPQPFSPDGDGANDTVDIALVIDDASPVGSWELLVVDANGRTFHSFPAGGDAIRSVSWDGTNDAGDVVGNAVDYVVEYVVTDSAGNEATGSTSLPLDILTEAKYGQRRVLIDDILFEGFTARYLSWNSSYSRRNTATLDRLAELFNRFPDYDIEIHGHAVSLLYYDDAESDRENREILMPLSQRRADVITEALVARGVDADRFTTDAHGKDRPIIPFSDIAQRFLNRRVEFYLVK